MKGSAFLLKDNRGVTDGVVAGGMWRIFHPFVGYGGVLAYNLAKVIYKNYFFYEKTAGSFVIYIDDRWFLRLLGRP